MLFTSRIRLELCTQFNRTITSAARAVRAHPTHPDKQRLNFSFPFSLAVLKFLFLLSVIQLLLLLASALLLVGFLFFQISSRIAPLAKLSGNSKSRVKNVCRAEEFVFWFSIHVPGAQRRSLFSLKCEELAESDLEKERKGEKRTNRSVQVLLD